RLSSEGILCSLSVLCTGTRVFEINTLSLHDALPILFKIAKKQPVDWKGTAAKLVAAIVIYALTFIGPVESFLSADRLLLLSAVRSEEHTSELQSRFHLVCRLLLENKKGSTGVVHRYD